MQSCCIVLLAWLASTTMAHTAIAATPGPIREVWADDGSAFARAVKPGFGFSFEYREQTVGSQLPGDWRASVSADKENDYGNAVLTHPSGLLVTRETRVLRAFDAVEYKLRFKNTTSRRLPPISQIESLDISFGEAVLDGNCVVSSGGGRYDGVFPPRSLAVRTNCPSPIAEYSAKMTLGSVGGRSSDNDLPFFFIQNDAVREGVFVAFGWSGQWVASVARSSQTSSLNIKARMPDVEIALEPGEEIEGPTVLFGLYAGSLADGSNSLRRLIREIYTPRLAGATFLPVALYDHWFNIGNNFDEPLLKRLTTAAVAVDQEYFLLDGGWASGGHPDGNGNYTVDATKFPNGIQSLAADVRSKGLGFGLWFEPERVAPHTALARTHPDWVLWKHTSYSERSHNRQAFPAGTGLLDYGRVEVREWVKNLLDRYIRDYDLRYVRYDFNLEPLPYWDANDPPGRRGITQLRHIQGLYAVLDWVRARHPTVIFEGCASGGNRIDLEMARRFHTFVISDFNADPALLRFHLHGINYFLPGNYHFLAYTLPAPYQRNFQPDDLGFQSLFGGAFGVSGRIDLWPQAMQEMARKHVRVWKSLRRYLVADYYPLTTQPVEMESWSGWQFHDPADQSGFLQAFRTGTRDSTHKFFPRGFDIGSSYRFVDLYDGSTWTLSGRQAMENGIEITQQRMSSRILKYHKIGLAPETIPSRNIP